MILGSIAEKNVRRLRIELVNLDASNSSRFRAEVSQLLDENVPLILDLTSVQFADSSGLGALCSLAAKAGPGRLTLENVSVRLARVLARVPALERLQRSYPILSVMTA